MKDFFAILAVFTLVYCTAFVWGLGQKDGAMFAEWRNQMNEVAAK